ncbi:MAG: sigma-70 family RNA polymerase sigma factor [Myxococcales bacterium]|nr:sigma-70 family RNA polymerase sigma factor [Myxococcales bacterium]
MSASTASLNVEERFSEAADEAAEDELLVARFLEGDNQAFDQLYRRHGPRVYRLALRMMGSAADAEDLVQVVFERAWRALPRFRQGEARVSTWLYRVTVNACFDQLKSARRKRERGMEPDAFAQQADRRRGPEERVAAAQARGLVEQALQSLPEKYRVVVVLRDIEERSYQELRAILKLPITTLKMRAVRGREQLARACERLGHEGGR